MQTERMRGEVSGGLLVLHGRSAAAAHLGTFNNYNILSATSRHRGHPFVIRRDDSSIYPIPRRQDRAHTLPLEACAVLYTNVKYVQWIQRRRQAGTYVQSSNATLQLHCVTSRSSLFSPHAMTLLRNRQGVHKAKTYGVRNVGGLD